MNLVKRNLKIMMATILGIVVYGLIVGATYLLLIKVFHVSNNILTIVHWIFLIILFLVGRKFLGKIMKQEKDMKPSTNDLIQSHNFNRWAGLILAIIFSLPILFFLLLAIFPQMNLGLIVINSVNQGSFGFRLLVVGMLLLIFGPILAFFWWMFYVNNKRYKELTTKK
jgi:hypothetical protein